MTCLRCGESGHRHVTPKGINRWFHNGPDAMKLDLDHRFVPDREHGDERG